MLLKQDIIYDNVSNTGYIPDLSLVPDPPFDSYFSTTLTDILVQNIHESSYATNLYRISPIAFSQLTSKLNSYLNYQDGWDGYDGKAPNRRSIEDAIKILSYLYLSDCILPYSGLASDGEVDLFWEQGNIFVDIGFIGDGTFSYYARNANSKEYFGDNIPLNDIQNREIIETIKSIRV